MLTYHFVDRLSGSKPMYKIMIHTYIAFGILSYYNSYLIYNQNENLKTTTSHRISSLVMVCIFNKFLQAPVQQVPRHKFGYNNKSNTYKNTYNRY